MYSVWEDVADALLQVFMLLLELICVVAALLVCASIYQEIVRWW